MVPIQGSVIMIILVWDSGLASVCKIVCVIGFERCTLLQNIDISTVVLFIVAFAVEIGWLVVR